MLNGKHYLHDGFSTKSYAIFNPNLQLKMNIDHKELCRILKDERIEWTYAV